MPTPPPPMTTMRLDRALLGAVGPDLGGGDELARRLDEVDLAGLEELLDTAHQLLHDLVLAGHRLGEVEVPAQVEARHGAVRAHPLEVARVEERLRGDASDRHTDPTDAVLLDEGDLRAAYAGVQRRHGTAGPPPPDRDVVPVGH